MTKQANILNRYELKTIVMSKQFDCNKFYKYELGNMINILKEENKSLRDTIEKIKKRCEQEISASQVQYERKATQQTLVYKVAHERILDILNKGVDE